MPKTLFLKEFNNKGIYFFIQEVEDYCLFRLKIWLTLSFPTSVNSTQTAAFFDTGSNNFTAGTTIFTFLDNILDILFPSRCVIHSSIQAAGSVPGNRLIKKILGDTIANIHSKKKQFLHQYNSEYSQDCRSSNPHKCQLMG